MIKKLQRGPPPPPNHPHQEPESQFNRLSNSSSSNALVSSTHPPYVIPMEDLNLHKSGSEIEHDALPPAVDYTGVQPTARYQFRALARRALSYHRRQRINNMCCLVIWPVLLVLLCFVLTAITGSDNIKGFNGVVGFCVNEANPQTSPAFTLDQVPFPQSGNKQVAAWYPGSFWNRNSNSMLPCVRWFGDSYPFKAPYENVSAADAAIPDSYYTPPPATGWFNLEKIEDAWFKASTSSDGMLRSPALWSMPTINQTVYYTAANPQIAQILGTVPNVTRSFSSPTWPPANASIIWNTTAPGVNLGTGLFGAIRVRYASQNDFKAVTFANGSNSYEPTTDYSSQSFVSVADQATMDKTISDMITNMAQNGVYDDSRLMPFGGMNYDVLNITAQLRAKITMQFGQPPSSDYSYGASTPPGLRQIISMTQLTNAIVKTKYAGQYVISQGVRALPFEFNTDSSKGYFLNQMSAYLFPFGLSFLLPTFVSILVQEKEDRHRMMMAMNGLRPVSYYLAHYVEFFTMQMILSLFFCLTCVAISSQFILRTDPSIIIVLLIIWSHVQTTMSFLIATLFSKTRRATLIVYFFVAITCIMSSIASQIFKDGKPFAWYIHPSFSFFNILYVGILHSSRVNGLYPLTWSDFAAGTVLFKCLILMIGESILFLLLTFYIDAVAPSEYGVQKPWYFPITSLFRRRSSSRHHASLSSTPYAHGSEDILEDADTDVYAERDRVQNQYDPVKTPLIIQNLFHRYRGKVEPALKGLSFGVETNTVLGLLGPNGAGKSTLIHLLTGLYSPTSGTACVAGANIRTDMSTVHAKIGVCPQHDILWGDLTVADHMLFYARMRGIPPALEQQAVTYAIASVSLTKFRDRQIKGLSGGEKRRVSIAIALLGDNSVIFLDEPSTGLDPAVRRIIWDIINRVKVNKTVVLTTHSMEEADILSDRIAIMTLGRLRCIGTSLHLKELYGSGFRLNISSKPGKLQEACESVEKQILKGFNFRRIDKFTNATTYEFDPQQQDRQGQTASTGQLSRVFSCLSQAGMFPAIEDWGLSQTTLEDVFIKIVTEGDSAIALPAIVSP